MEIKKYKDLLDYYKKELSMMDYIHCNSKITESVFSQFIPNANYNIIPITHSGINDNRRKKDFSSNNIQMMFVGNITAYKGFPLLKETLIKLFNEGYHNWELNIWGGKEKKDNDCPLIHHRGKYKQDEIERIYEQTDLLIVPSIWKETFSLVTLEAISYGVPTLVSENVGAKDIIAQYNSFFIFKDKDDLYIKLKNLLQSNEELIEFNKRIIEIPWKYSMEQHTKDIENLIYKPLLNSIKQ